MVGLVEEGGQWNWWKKGIVVEQVAEEEVWIETWFSMNSSFSVAGSRTGGVIGLFFRERGGSYR